MYRTTSTTPSPPASSPGSLSSTTTTSSSSERGGDNINSSSTGRVPPISPPEHHLYLSLSDTTNHQPKYSSNHHHYSSPPKPPPNSRHHSTLHSNPQPFFPSTVINTPRAPSSSSRLEEGTSYGFPTTTTTTTTTTDNLKTRFVTEEVNNRSSRTPSPPSSGVRTRPVERTRRQSTLVYGGGGGAGGGATSPNAAGGNQLEAKVVILGSQGVGKTSVVTRYTSGQFSMAPTSTIGASFLTKKLIVEGCKVRLQIWDTAGQERFRSMAPLYYRGAVAAILMYDITNMDSFYDIKLWLDELRRNMSSDLIIHVVGSKADLSATHRQVDETFARYTVATWIAEAKAAEEALTQHITNPHSSPPHPSSSTYYNPHFHRDTSPPSPSRSRLDATTTRRGSITPLIPTITTSAPQSDSSSSSTLPPPPPPPLPPLDTLGARVRKLSTKLSSSTSTPTLLDSLASPSSSSTGSENHPGGGGGMTRSGSLKLLGNTLGGMTRSQSIGGSASSGGRRSFEEEQRIVEENEKERMEELVRGCGVEVSEVTVHDELCIEELFYSITLKLVERKTQIETERVLRSRDSFVLRDQDDESTTPAGWCC